MELLVRKLLQLPLGESLVQYRNQARLEAWLQGLHGVESRIIGHSRQGQALHGLTLGSGHRPFSILAGCHADEPVGPMTAQALPQLLHEHFPGLLREFRIHIIPQMNPDGADRNRVWFANPLAFGPYHATVQRELPGDDIEFGFGGKDPRPECRAAMAFLGDQGPFHGHCSLHGLACAEGAWFLIHPPWQGDTLLRESLARVVEGVGLGLHDSDRRGEKGFHRIAPGFCTTPNHRAMAQWFHDQDDPETAARFQPNSMEWIASLGGSPLCLVSELPLFLLAGPPNPADPPAQQFRRALADLDGTAPRVHRQALEALLDTWQVRPLPLLTQIRLQCALVVLALERTLRKLS